MRKKYEVVGLVIDAKKEYEKLHFFERILGCSIEDFETAIVQQKEKMNTSQYLASISEMKDDLFSVQALLDSVNMRDKENTLIRDLTIGERKIIALIKFVVCNKSRCVLQNLFLGMSEMEVKKANVLLVEISTYTDVYLIEPTTYGFEICDRIEYLSDNQ